MSIRTSSLYALLMALGLAGFPFVASISALTSVDSTPISVFMRTATLLLSVALISLSVTKTSSIRFLRGWYWIPAAVFFTAYIARIAIDTTVYATTLSRPPIDYWIWAIGASFVPFLALATSPSVLAFGKMFRWSFGLAITAALLIAITGSGEIVRGLSIQDTGRFRLGSLNPISVGQLGATLILLSIWRINSNNVLPRTKVALWACLLASALGLYLLIASASRGPLLSLLVATTFYLLLTGGRQTVRIIIALLLATVAGYFVAVRLDAMGYAPIERLMMAARGESLTFDLRMEAYRGAVDQFLESPFFGDAIEERTTGFYPHNIVIESFLATGLAGGLAFLFMLLGGFRAAVVVIRKLPECSWVAILFVQYFAAAQTSGAIYSSTTFWCLLGGVIGLAGSRALMKSTSVPQTAMKYH